MSRHSEWTIQDLEDLRNLIDDLPCGHHLLRDRLMRQYESQRSQMVSRDIISRCLSGDIRQEISVTGMGDKVSLVVAPDFSFFPFFLPCLMLQRGSNYTLHTPHIRTSAQNMNECKTCKTRSQLWKLELWSYSGHRA